jgi:hypothetical protein
MGPEQYQSPGNIGSGEEFLRIEVVFSGFIDHPDQAALSSFWIGQYFVNPSDHQGGSIPFVFDTYNVFGIAIFSYHL